MGKGQAFNDSGPVALDGRESVDLQRRLRGHRQIAQGAMHAAGRQAAKESHCIEDSTI